MNELESWVDLHTDGAKTEYFEHGRYKVTTDRDGDLIGESWFDKDGEGHRDGDLPALIFYENKNIIKSLWCIHGGATRTNGLPAHICYDEEGNVSLAEWRKDGSKIDIDSIIEHHQLDHDWRNWSDADLLIVRMAIS